ncbi:MAG TPA: trypsin-like peptidase domain-containing protein, partial [Telluria sp.]|nr:trypsin-like peptidase domain-containing protein [Telluria sp.]
TNHHVLPDAATAADSIIQFNYEADIDGKMEQVRTARFDAARYLSSETLDFALAGVTAEQGELPQHVFTLIGSPAKIVHNEPVTIIQHPGAQPKQVALRDNKLLDVLPDFLHYSTDTEAGASGSPVCNDQWEVVALHHAGVPAPGGGDNWIANEGVRVSRIVAWLKQQDTLPEPVRAMVDLVLGQDSGPPAPVVSGPPPEAAPVRPATAVPQSLAAAAAPARLEVGVGDFVAEVSVNLRPARPEGLLSGLLGTGPRKPLPGFIHQLEAGDVLLYSGTGILSEGIKFFTNSDVSHAALYLGGQGGLIGEAVDAGVVPRPPSVSFPGHEWVVVHRLPARRDMAPVLQRADFYLKQGLRYAYPQLVLLGILLLVKRVRPSGVLGKMLQAVFIAAADTLNRFVDSGRDLMICSEFVYRCFDEATPAADGPYRLEVPWVAREALAADALPPAVERGSLADVLMREGEQAGIGFKEAAESLSMQLPLNQQALQAQAEYLLAEHMAEERWGRNYKLPPPQSLLDPPVAAAAARFAMALRAARVHAAGRAPVEAWPVAAAPVPEAGGLPPALQSLLRTPADFVTPADLRASPSLVEAGRIF